MAYRVLEKEGKYKIQERGWFGWYNLGYIHGLDMDLWSVSYYNSLEEAERQMNEFIEQDKKPKATWKEVLINSLCRQ